MRKIIFILLFVSIKAFPAEYYIATDGSDLLGDGAISTPWYSLSYAITQMTGGDTLYFRAGTYYFTDKTSFPGGALNGTSGERTFLGKYPLDVGEVIFDYENYSEPAHPNQTAYPGALLLTAHGDGYLHFKGFTVRNVLQKDSFEYITAIITQGAHNLIFENITVSNIGGRGWLYETPWGYPGEPETDTTRFINCDAFNCADTLPTVYGDPTPTPGNAADGFKTYGNSGSYIVYQGCRSIEVSDDGFDLGNGSQIIIDSCWSASNGYLSNGEGTAFKTGGLELLFPADSIARIIKNCIAAECKNGFRILDYYDYFRTPAIVIGNLSVNNLNYPGMAEAFGFTIDRNAERGNPLARFYNNISYNNPFNWRTSYQEYEESHNTWDGNSGYPGFVESDSVTVTADDFVSLDVELLKSPRKPGGWLPDVPFGQLVAGSDLIKAGTAAHYADVEAVIGYNIPYDSVDIGYKQLTSQSITYCDTVSNKVTATYTTIVDTSGTGVGQIDLTPADGITPYSYAWSGGSTDQDRTGLVTGTYFVTVTDDSTCTWIGSIFVGNYTAAALTEGTTTVSAASSTGNGRLTASATGGVTPLSYLWSNGAISATANNLKVGAYRVTIYDASNDSVGYENIYSINKVLTGETIYGRIPNDN